MKNKSYPFAATTIKCKELSLISDDKMGKMATAKDAQEALKMLYEVGYGKKEISTPYEFEQLIDSELKATYDLIGELSPDPKATHLFLLQHDVHNLKVYVKARVLEKPISQEALVEGGVFPQKKLEEMVRDEEFASLPHALQEGMAALLKDLAVKPDVSRIDTALDVAYSQYVLEELGHVKDENIRQIFQITFDFDNVMILLRLKRKGASRQMLKNTLLYGGSISHELLEEIYPLSVSEIAAILSKGKYEKAMETGFLEYTRKNTLDGFARERDNGIMEIARKNRHDMLTIAPVIGYMLGKQREAEAVRMVMISKLNQISSEDTLNRVRDLYV